MVKPGEIMQMQITPTFRAMAGTGGKSYDSSFSSCSNKLVIKANKIASTKTATPEQVDGSSFSAMAMLKTMFLAKTSPFTKH